MGVWNKKRTMKLSEGIPCFHSWSCSLSTLGGASHCNDISCSVTIFWSPDSAERLSPLQTCPCISEITLPARSEQRTASQGIPDTKGCSGLWGLANTRISYDLPLLWGFKIFVTGCLLFIIFSFSFLVCFFFNTTSVIPCLCLLVSQPNDCFHCTRISQNTILFFVSTRGEKETSWAHGL